MNVLGIDPGKKGAVCVLFEYDIYMENIPIIGKEYDIVKLNSFFIPLSEGIAYIEKVNSFGMGRTSAFNFGYGVGLLEGLIVANDLKIKRIRPQEWQKEIFKGISGKKPKEKALLVMKEQYKEILKKIEEKKVDKAKKEGLIDAFLIACYGWKKEFGMNWKGA